MKPDQDCSRIQTGSQTDLLGFICSASERLITQQKQQRALSANTQRRWGMNGYSKKKETQIHTKTHEVTPVLVHARVAGCLIFSCSSLSGSDLHHSMNKAAERRKSEGWGGRGRCGGKGETLVNPGKWIPLCEMTVPVLSADLTCYHAHSHTRAPTHTHLDLGPAGIKLRHHAPVLMMDVFLSSQNKSALNNWSRVLGTSSALKNPSFAFKESFWVRAALRIKTQIGYCFTKHLTASLCLMYQIDGSDWKCWSCFLPAFLTYTLVLGGGEWRRLAELAVLMLIPCLLNLIRRRDIVKLCPAAELPVSSSSLPVDI